MKEIKAQMAKIIIRQCGEIGQALKGVPADARELTKDHIAAVFIHIDKLTNTVSVGAELGIMPELKYPLPEAEE